MSNNKIKTFLSEVTLRSKISDLIINVPDFPKEGIQFKDITPVLQNNDAMSALTNHYSEIFNDMKNSGKVNKIVAIESRGFIFGSLLSLHTGLPMVLARKPGKLPRDVDYETYSLEYGGNSLEIQKDDIAKGDKIIIVDDLIATGGTIKAVAIIAQRLGAKITGVWNLIELKDLKGRNNIQSVCKEKELEFFSTVVY